MSLWLALTLGAVALWAFVNIIDATLRQHFLDSNGGLTWVAALMKIPAVIVIFSIFGLEWPEGVAGYYMLLAGVLYIIPIIFYYQAMSMEETSRVALFIETIPLWSLLHASILLNERLTGTQGLAFILIISGSVLAAFKPSRKKWHFSVAFLWILLATFLWALEDVIFKKFEPGFEEFWSAFGLFYLGALLYVFAPLVSKKVRGAVKTIPKKMTKGWGALIVTNEILTLAAAVMFKFALTLNKASLTLVVAAIQPLFVFIFGVLLSRVFHLIRKEPISAKILTLKATSLVLIVIGFAFM